jgi:alanine racemase
LSTRLTIDLAALEANYRLFERTGSIGAVVKADAYGLGVDAVTASLLRAGCADLFVAQAREAVEVARLVRQEGRSARVWVFEGCTPWNTDLLDDELLIPVLNSAEQIQRYRSSGGGVCGLHVDTGMQRLGFPHEFIERLDVRSLDVELLLTHFACADTPEHPLNTLQIERFDSARRRFASVPVSIGGSAALLGDYPRRLPPVHVSRPGIGLYGGNPLASGPNPLHRVVMLEARILQVRNVPAGTPVGYGASVTTSRPTRIATVGIGYADGLPRVLSGRGSFAIGGRRVPILGRVSMDLTQVDVTGMDAAEGDWLEVIGETVTLDEVARAAGTVPYEILTGLGARLDRTYRV